ncbi:MAG: molybdopterin-guanine dinucleotide biosynthesis protein B [Magnetospirillum sp.]|nr:molybdopterin-guanine dinucleotide biosynthesis protein B [Magnetospirillum sp.]
MKVFGIAGWSGSGKTTLLVRLIPVLVRLGARVATVKHTHHDPLFGGGDERALAAAGAVEVLSASPRRFCLTHDLAGRPAPLGQLIDVIDGIDLLIVEGFKFGDHPRLEVWDPALGKPLLAGQLPQVVAIACDSSVESGGLPVFRRDDVEGIAALILS